MDGRPRHNDQGPDGTDEQAVSRRAFFNRARLSVLGVAGVALFGVATSTGLVAAVEDPDGEKKKKKDDEGKEKKKKTGNSDENTSNTKKNKKNTNGDTSKKKKAATATPTTTAATSVASGTDKYACKDFGNQAHAQAVLRADPTDPNGLDGNRNGIACDGSEAILDGVPAGLMMPPFDLTPVTRPKATSRS